MLIKITANFCKIIRFLIAFNKLDTVKYICNSQVSSPGFLIAYPVFWNYITQVKSFNIVSEY